ncbi:MAG: ABC transporter permease, partial [Myxococcales bacterium]|nr:ABC transporter permease [Myxococcales bacterium]
IGNKSMLFIATTLAFLGMITVFQVTTQVKQVLPELSMIGPAFIQLMVREFGPTICGLMVATRVGSGIAAEIGSMVVTEQIDALKMSNADPVHYLIAPRFLACSVMLVILAILGCLVATTSGVIMAQLGFGIHPKTFLNLGLVKWSDVVIGLCKAFAYGMAIPVISAHSGLNTKGGSEGVGWATTMAVVNSSFAVIVLDLVISVAGYLVLY